LINWCCSKTTGDSYFLAFRFAVFLAAVFFTTFFFFAAGMEITSLSSSLAKRGIQYYIHSGNFLLICQEK
jgi:hypothetical protein